jgi:peptidyl-prolyl cis-trans isomerase B (cyclophilin B)
MQRSITLMIPMILVLTFCLTGPVWATEKPQVIMETSKGTVVIELNIKKAPTTTANFLAYVESGFYDNTIFHRVIRDFMIQGGGLTVDMQKKPNQPPIRNEADNGLKNNTGTIAMARTGDPHSATSQFFINVKDNPLLNHHAKTPRGWGYCVFGRVIKGMDVVRAIESVPTGRKSGRADVPIEPVVIKRITKVKPVKAAVPQSAQ